MADKKQKKQSKPLNTTPWLVAIALLSLWVFSSNFNGEILNFDDNEYFENYPEITHLSFENIGKYFTRHYVIMYHPLPVLSFALQYQLSGLSPLPMHLFNWLFHLANILLVFALVRQLSHRPMAALLAALIFAVHPMNTEAVSWISARSSVMYSCFFLLSLLYYLRYLRAGQEKTKWYSLSVLFALLSFFSKVNALPLPIVLLAIDWFCDRRFIIKNTINGQVIKSYQMEVLYDKIPYFIMAVVFGLVAIADKGTSENLSLGTESYGFVDGVLFSLYSLNHYFISFFAPLHLSAIHTYPLKSGGSLPVTYYLSPLFSAGVLYALYRFRTQKILLFGFAFFCIVVSVTLQIIPSRLFMMADRYVYLPYLGFAMIVGYYASQHWQSTDLKLRRRARNLSLLVVIWCLVLVGIARQRNQVWNTTKTLVSDIIEKNNEHPYLARAYGLLALENEKEGKLDLALANLNKALALREEGETFYNRGRLLFYNRKYKAAIADFEKAQELLDENAVLSNYLGGAEFNLGNYNKAIAHYRKAVLADPDFAEAWRNMGSCYGMQNQYNEAEACLTESIKYEANNAEGYRLRGLVYLKINNREKACSDLLRAKQLGANQVDELLKLNNCIN